MDFYYVKSVASPTLLHDQSKVRVELDGFACGQLFCGRHFNLQGQVIGKGLQRVEIHICTGWRTQKVKCMLDQEISGQGSPIVHRFKATLNLARQSSLKLFVDGKKYELPELEIEKIEPLSVRFFESVCEIFAADPAYPETHLAAEQCKENPETSKAISMIRDMWVVMRVFQDRKPGAELASALHQFNKKHNAQHFARFKVAMNKYLLYPQELEITHHGALRTFRFWEGAEIDAHLADVLQILRAISGQGFPCFVYFGTLLGIIRDNSLIPHDDDVDAVCMFPQEGEQPLSHYLAKLENLVQQAGGEAFGDYPFHRHVRLGGKFFDIFIGVDHGEAITIHSYNTKTYPRAEMYPTKYISFRGEDYLAPNDPGAMMARYFGEDWQTPNENYYFS